MVADVVVIDEVGDDNAFQLEGIDGSLKFVGYFAVGKNEHGVRDGSFPLGIESGEEWINVGGAEHEVTSGGVQFIETLEDASLFVGIVDADGDKLKSTVAVHPWNFSGEL